MANNYCQFSEMIACEGIQKEALLERLVEADDAEEGPACEYEADKDGVWIHSEDNCNLEMLVGILACWQKDYGLEDALGLTWSNTCSAPRLGEFGGGGVVIHKGEEHWIDVTMWCLNKINEVEKESK